MRVLMSVVLLLHGLPALAGGAECQPCAPPKHVLNEPDERRGAQLKQSFAIVSLPPEKSYAQLSAGEKMLAKAPYEAMAEGDEPPYPVKGMKELLFAMRSISNLLWTEGQVMMVVYVNRHGDAETVDVIKTPDTELARYVATALVQQKYKPALCAGVPCAQGFLWNMNFEREIWR